MFLFVGVFALFGLFGVVLWSWFVFWCALPFLPPVVRLVSALFVWFRRSVLGFSPSPVPVGVLWGRSGLSWSAFVSFRAFVRVGGLFSLLAWFLWARPVGVSLRLWLACPPAFRLSALSGAVSAAASRSLAAAAAARWGLSR